MCDNPRYALYQSKYDMLLANRANAPIAGTFTVAGKCCESGDLLGEHVPLPVSYTHLLTVALAAKDSASNLFGGLIIIADKPFAVDDWIETPDLEGVVTDITLRSTRIRTFKDAEVIVPNSTLANSQIINWSRMKKRRVSFHLGLTYGLSLIHISAV